MYILLAHDYCILQQLAVCVQRSGSRKGSMYTTAPTCNVMCDLMNINQPICFSVFMNNNKPPNSNYLPTVLF